MIRGRKPLVGSGNKSLFRIESEEFATTRDKSNHRQLTESNPKTHKIHLVSSIVSNLYESNRELGQRGFELKALDTQQFGLLGWFGWVIKIEQATPRDTVAETQDKTTRAGRLRSNGSFA